MDGFISYTASAKTDPCVSGGPLRVVRGGSWNPWNSNSAKCRSAFRDYDVSWYSDSNFGFRVVLGPVLVP